MSTLLELETEVAEEIGSIDATVDKTKIDRFLNRGVLDFLRKTRCYVESETFTPGANLNYTLDATVLVLIDAYFTNASTALERVSVAEIHRLRRSALTGSSYPRRYAFQHPLIMFDVAPAATDTLTVVNVPKPTAMSASANDPATATYGGIPDGYHSAIALYAERFLGSYADDQSSSQGQRYKEWYEEIVKECKRDMRERGGRQNARSVVQPRRRYLPSNQSADI